jgi:NADH-quinone oxidoreductase subunit J
VTGEALAFGAVAVVIVAASLAVVLTPNLFHAVMYLAVALVATGVVFLLLESPFLFGVQLLLYAGGVVTLAVFAIMLTERLVGERIAQTSRYIANGAIVCAAVLAAVLGFLAGVPGVTAPTPAGDTTPAVGRALTGAFVLPFELLGVLLLASLLGALHLARADD